MAFCRNCGTEVLDEAVVCVNCGTAITPTSMPKTDDKKSGAWAFLCYLVPVLGLILWLVWKDDYPLRAKSCGKGAIVAVVMGTISAIIAIIFYALGISALLHNPDAAQQALDTLNTLMIGLR